jgi:hypothetical protein
MARLTKEQLKTIASDLEIDQVADLIAHIALQTSKDFMEHMYQQGDLTTEDDGPLTTSKIADDAANWIYETQFHYGELNTKVEKRIKTLKSQYKPKK